MVRTAPQDTEPATGRADALVVFGITGDLARVMTFRSLYRLEQRGLLDCPILGVAVEDWTDDDLRQHARAAIEATGEPVEPHVWDRLAARLSYVAGDVADAGTTAGSPPRCRTRRCRSSTWRSRRRCSPPSSPASPGRT